MRPTKLSSNIFLELPPVLYHYLKAERNLWLEGNPKRGRLTLLNRTGNFVDLEALAVERKQLLQTLGRERAMALRYRTGFEQGRRDAARHYESFDENARLALQAPLVYGQLQGRFTAESVKFEFDLDARTLYREIKMESCVEAVIHRMTLAEEGRCVCSNTAGYFSGHVSEILGRRALTLETECMCNDAPVCRFVIRLEQEWGSEADWVRAAMEARSVDEELAEAHQRVTQAQKSARTAQASLTDLHRRMQSDLLMDSIVAQSAAVRPAMQRARHLMASAAPMLLAGEPGVGKETLARAIHYGGPRKKKPFVVVDCGVFPGALLGQELMGHGLGASAGVAYEHKGAFRRAHGGTIYLGDIDQMPLDLQVQVLRILEEGSFFPAAADKPFRVDIRLIGGMGRRPQEALTGAHLREDLYYALSIGTIELPPLRERTEDVLPLAESFLVDLRQRYERPKAAMSPDFKQILLDCAWPGNIRQLRNVLEHAVVIAHDRELTPADLPEEILATRWRRRPQELSPEAVQAALKRTHNNRSAAANLLGVGRTTLWRAMKKLDIA